MEKFFSDGALATDNDLLLSSHIPFSIPFSWVQEIKFFIYQYINEVVDLSHISVLNQFSLQMK